MPKDSFADLMACRTKQEFKDIWLSLDEAEKVGLRRVQAVGDRAWELIRLSKAAVSA